MLAKILVTVFQVSLLTVATRYVGFTENQSLVLVLAIVGAIHWR